MQGIPIVTSKSTIRRIAIHKPTDRIAPHRPVREGGQYSLPCKWPAAAHLDGLVRPTRDQPRPRHVERRAEHARLGLERARLRHVVHVLERGARVPVPERERAVVAAGEEDALGVDGERVDDRVVAREVEHERALGALPLLDVVPPRGRGRERVLGRVDRERADRLFVVRERDHRLARSKVP